MRSREYCDISGNNCWDPTTGSLSGGLPAGAVMAFNLTSCPSGWVAADCSGGGSPDLRGAFVRGINGHENGRDINR